MTNSLNRFFKGTNKFWILKTAKGPWSLGIHKDDHPADLCQNLPNAYQHISCWTLYPVSDPASLRQL